MDIDELPGRVAAAAAATARLAGTLPDRVAELVLKEALPRTPRLSGTLAATGRVEDGAVVFGTSAVDYAHIVHARRPWVDDAAQATDSAVAETAGQALDTAVALL
jgi:hypothetical protein